MQSVLSFILIHLPILTKPAATHCAPIAFVAGIQSRIKCGASKGNTGGIFRSCRPTNGHEAQSVQSATPFSAQSTIASHIVSITSKNVAGMKNEENNDDIVIRFDTSHKEISPGAGFVAVTGESGSGKSLLVSKAIDLVTGGKAVASLLPSSGDELAESLVELGE